MNKDRIAVESISSKEIVQLVIDALEKQQIDRAIEPFADQFVFQDNGIGLEFKNKSGLAEFFTKIRELYPNASFHADTVVAVEDRVILEWRFEATVTEPVYGMLSARTQVSINGASVIRVENGEIVHWSDYYDGLTSRRTALAAYFTEWIEL